MELCNQHAQPYHLKYPRRSNTINVIQNNTDIHQYCAIGDAVRLSIFSDKYVEGRNISGYQLTKHAWNTTGEVLRECKSPSMPSIYSHPSYLHPQNMNK